MKIVICGSITFCDEMNELRADLEKKGHGVISPQRMAKDETGEAISIREYHEKMGGEPPADHELWDLKKTAILDHFKYIEDGDVVLVANYPKKGINHYVGANTLLEMGLALYLSKPIYILFGIPDIQYKEEILGMKPIILNGDLSNLIS